MVTELFPCAVPGLAASRLYAWIELTRECRDWKTSYGWLVIVRAFRICFLLQELWTDLGKQAIHVFPQRRIPTLRNLQSPDSRLVPESVASHVQHRQ